MWQACVVFDDNCNRRGTVREEGTVKLSGSTKYDPYITSVLYFLCVSSDVEKEHVKLESDGYV